MGRSDVEAGEKRWLEAFNGGDASGTAACYEESARLMAPNTDTLEGRSAIEAFTKEFLQSQAKLAFNLVTVYESPDFCVAVGRYQMEIPGAPNDNGKFVEVWRRQGDGSWLIADDIFNSNVPAPS